MIDLSEKDEAALVELISKYADLEPVEAEKKALAELLAIKKKSKEETVFHFERIGKLEPKAPAWLVKGLIESDAFGCLFGDPGAGKSFLAIELSAAVATNTPFYGFMIKRPGPVIYLAGEGRAGLLRRFHAWSIARNVSLSDAPLYLNAGPISLIDNNLMIPVVKALEKLIEELGRFPALVILDTWSRTLGGDDSAPSDGAAGVAALDSLRSRFGNFACLVVHHEGHLKGRGRGWSGLRAAVDVELRVERGPDNILRLECTKAKDTEPLSPMAFQFVSVELGIKDEDGFPVSSAVLNEVDYMSMASKEPAGKNQSLALSILKESGGNISVNSWRDKCKAAGLDRRRFSEVKNELEKSKRIIINDFYVLLPDSASVSVSVSDPLYRGVGRTDTLDRPKTDNSDTFGQFGHSKASTPFPELTVEINAESPPLPEIPPEFLIQKMINDYSSEILSIPDISGYLNLSTEVVETTLKLLLDQGKIESPQSGLYTALGIF